MSVTIVLMGKRTKLANGKWQAADQMVQQMLNNHLNWLEIPAHNPPQSKELIVARAAKRIFGVRIIRYKPIPIEESLNPDGTQRVY